MLRDQKSTRLFEKDENRRPKPGCGKQVISTKNPSPATGSAEKLGKAVLCFESELSTVGQPPANPQLGAKPEARRGRDPSKPEDGGWSCPSPSDAALQALAHPAAPTGPASASSGSGGAAGAPPASARQSQAGGGSVVAPAERPEYSHHAGSDPSAPVTRCRHPFQRGHPWELPGDIPAERLGHPRGPPGDGGGRYSRRRAGGRAAPGHGGSAGGAAERPLRL